MGTNNQQILEKAIQKAIDNGWEYPFGANCYEINKYVKARAEVIAFGLRQEWQDTDSPGHLEGHWSIPELIYNHEFAKSLWGDKPIATSEVNSLKVWVASRAWQYHLIMMVVSDDPIKYLGENIQ